MKAVSGFGSKMGSTVPPRSGNSRVRDKAGGGDQEEDTSQVPVTQLVAAYTPLFLAKRALYDAASAEKLGRGGGKEKVEAEGEGRTAAGGFENGNIDPVEQLSKLLAERNALRDNRV